MPRPRRDPPMLLPARGDAPGPRTADVVADAVRAAILSGGLAPGTPLREEELSTAHGVSRHTARTALATLTAERAGVVTSIDAEVGQVVSAGQLVARVARIAHEYGRPVATPAQAREILGIKAR